MRSVQEIHPSLSSLGLLEPWLELVFKKIQLHLIVGLARARSRLAESHAQTFGHQSASLAVGKANPTKLRNRIGGLFGAARRIGAEIFSNLLQVFLDPAGRAVVAVLQACRQTSRKKLIYVRTERSRSDAENRAGLFSLAILAATILTASSLRRNRCLVSGSSIASLISANSCCVNLMCFMHKVCIIRIH